MDLRILTTSFSLLDSESNNDIPEQSGEILNQIAQTCVPKCWDSPSKLILSNPDHIASLCRTCQNNCNL